MVNTLLHVDGQRNLKLIRSDGNDMKFMASEVPIRSAYLALIHYLKTERAPIIHQQELAGYRFEIRTSTEKIFTLSELPNGFVLLSVLSPASVGAAEDISVERRKETTTLRYHTAIGAFSIKTRFEVSDGMLLHYRIRFTPDQPIFYKDDDAGLLILNKDLSIPKKGNIHLEQLQMRSGACFLDFGKGTSGNLFYFQDLSTLNPYAEDSNISLSDSVRAQWPEVHFVIPSRMDEHLKEGKAYNISDGYISYNNHKPKSPYEVAHNLLQHQFELYQHLQ